MSQSSVHSTFSFTYLKVFLLVVFFLIFGALTVRGVTLVKNRSFVADSFNMLVYGSDSAYLYNIDLDPQHLAVIEIENYSVLFDPANRRAASIVLGIPIHGTVYISDAEERLHQNTETFFHTSTLFEMFFVPGKYLQDNINFYDVLRMYFGLFGLDEDSFVTETIDVSSLSYESFAQYLRNDEVFNEKVSVEVVNATDVNRLGRDVADMLLLSGVNVVSVVGGESRMVSVVEYKDTVNEETDKILLQFFGIPAQMSLEDSAVSDVRVIVGKDLGDGVEEMMSGFSDDTIEQL